MMLVPNFVAPSSIHGMGLFAAEPIAAGTCIWKYQEPFDARWSREYVDSLPLEAKRFVLHYCAQLKSGEFLVSGDNDRFINHSENPNCGTDERALIMTALRDIAAGEELTEDYRTFCVRGTP